MRTKRCGRFPTGSLPEQPGASFDSDKNEDKNLFGYVAGGLAGDCMKDMIRQARERCKEETAVRGGD